MILLPVARAVLLALEILLALPLLYLLALAIGAAIGTIRRPHAPAEREPISRFAISTIFPACRAAILACSRLPRSRRCGSA